ncbi:DUF418 domain-containing protein [Jannaschia sp. R86511]|uniref:DUF418 domain-containing protein n=1 Tax=Jannaschia sp. R86511 TaxID=3093853 RepID=UPI0036D2D4CC
MPDQTSSGPVRTRERVLAPDLARGLALLGIALANCVVYVSGREVGPLLRPVDGTTADRAVDTVVGLFVDNRAFPMFTMLFAYGFVMILRRQAAAGVPWPQARSVLLRRSAWLAAFGAAHMLLLFFGDILLTYGLLGAALVFALRWSDRVLVLVGAASLVVFVGLGALDGLGGELASLGGQPTSQTFLGDLGLRLLTFVGTVLGAPMYVIGFAPAAVVGVLLARRGVLEDPTQHLPLLRRLSAGLVVSVLGALPLVLMATQVIDYGPVTSALAGMLHGGTGLVGAAAFIGLVGWFVGARQQRAARAGRDLPARPRGPVGALAAVGERSLTCYLLQSVMFVPLLSPWALGLADGAGTAPVSAVAVGVYLVTLVVAVALDRAGRPGPAEQLLRRLVYGSRTSAAPAAGVPAP